MLGMTEEVLKMEEEQKHFLLHLLVAGCQIIIYILYQLELNVTLPC